MTDINKSLRGDQTVERKHISQLLSHIEEYEIIKKKKHLQYKTVKQFYEDKKICKQNFIKYYNRYLQADRNASILLPQKEAQRRGTKLQQLIMTRF